MRNILKIIKIAKPLYHLVLALSFLILLGAIVELVSPILSKFIVDEIIKNIQGKGGSFQRLFILIAAAFGANLLGIILTAFSERLGDHFSGRLRKFLTEKFYDKVLRLPQSYFDSEISGKIVNQLNRAIDSIRNFINASSNFILPMFLQTVFTIAVLAYYSVPVALFMAILFPVYMGLSFYSTKRWGLEEIKKNQIEDLTRGRISEVVSNIKLVRGFNNQKREFQFVSNNLSEINKIYARQSRTFHIFDFYRNLSLQIIILAVNIVIFYNAFTQAISIGTMVLLIQLVSQARRPLFAMSFILTQIQTAESGSKEYFEILGLEEKEDFRKEVPGKKLKGVTLEFKNVSFRYQGTENVLKNVSFKIDKNETVALVGPSGTGKTTIVNLLLKFYEPNSGEIYISGKPYKNLDHNFVRNNMALVFQESELFSTSVLENVEYGNSKAKRKEIESALRLANAYDFVMALPNGIDTEVGERGVKLSGGQKQRIQIARAILKDAPVLILDEATSSLDAKSELEVQKALENLMKNRVVIIVAHRFSTIQNVNKVAVVDEGKIVDFDNPQKLSTRPGIYADLLRFQVEGNRKLLEKFEIY